MGGASPPHIDGDAHIRPLSLLSVESQNSGGRPSSLNQVARAIVLKVPTRKLMIVHRKLKKYRLDNIRAKYEEEAMLRRLNHW